MEEPQLDLFEPLEFEPARYRIRHRTQPQSCDGSIVSRRDRLNVRDKVLIARYYYWTEIERRRFDDVMKILAEREFFIDERRIGVILVEQDELYRQMCQEKPSRTDLKKRYPGFDWYMSANR